MESQKPKIAMYVKRPFGEKLNASFDFIKENWKQLFKYSTYLKSIEKHERSNVYSSEH